jgi:hypothetical protein
LRSKRRVCASLLLGTLPLIIAIAAPVLAGPVLEDVVFSSAQEEHPTASADYVAWSVYKPRTKTWSVRVRPTNEPTFTANTMARTALGAIDGTTLVYQSYSRRSSSIRFLDLVTGTNTGARCRQHRRLGVLAEPGGTCCSSDASSPMKIGI